MGHIEKFLDKNQELAMFPLTDSLDILEEYKHRYRSKLIYRDRLRTDNHVGTHYCKQNDKRQLGYEIIVDTYIAAKCDYFIGFVNSNVSTTVLHLKDWQLSDYVLLGENKMFKPCLHIHVR